MQNDNRQKSSQTFPPRVALCGRPNVGKSSLFNRLIGRKKALVLNQPGVTRDVYRAETKFGDYKLELADLAGLEFQYRDFSPEEAQLRKLSEQAALEYLKTVDLVLFVFDGRSPVTPADEDLAKRIRTLGKNVLLVLSKIEGEAEAQAQSEVSTLGFGEGIPTSAEHNLGIEDLKEKVIAQLFTESEVLSSSDEEKEASTSRADLGTKKRPIKLGVYGRPNVGKSSLVNFLVGEKRMITSPIAGTTVDTVDTDLVQNEKHYRILDTAGIRRKSKTEKGVEVLSVVKALHSLSDVDVAFFMIDGYEGVTDQDEKIAGEIVKTGKPVIMLVNKWDLCLGKKEEYAERVRKALGFLDFAPILFVSAEKGEGFEPVWDLIDEILSQRLVVAPTGELNRFLELVEGANNPTGVKLYYASQTSKNPPTITFMVSDPKKVHFAYERYLKNELRTRYGWMGSPLRLVFKARKRSPSKKGLRRS